MSWLPLAQGVLAAIVIFALGWFGGAWAASTVRTIVYRRQLDEALGRFLASLVRWTVVAVAVVAALGSVGVETTSIAALFASAGIAIGLALQGSLSNFAAGVMLLVFRPFDIGQRVQAGGSTGVVEEIGLFATTLITPQNETVIVPNSTITNATIINFTVKGTLRGDLTVGVAYGADMTVVQAALIAAASKPEVVLSDPAPAVIFAGFGASSLDFVVQAWSAASDYRAMLHQVRVAIYDELNAQGIEIPFDQVVVHRADQAAAAAAK